jgi:Tfp pilus assembly protein PilF
MTTVPGQEAAKKGARGSGSREAGLRRLGMLVTVVVAVVLVVVIALVLRACAKEPSARTGGLQGPLVSAVTGTTDQLTPGEISTVISVLPAADRVQPAEQEWAALLPDLEQAARAAPDDPDAQRALALAYYNLGRFDEAAAIYERLLAGGEDAVLRNRLGNTLRDMNDVTGAEAAYRKAIADDPALAAPYLNLAELLWRQGRDGEALSTIDQGLEAVPEEGRAALEAGRKVLEPGGD